MRFPQITLSSLALVVSLGVNLFVAGWLLPRIGIAAMRSAKPAGSTSGRSVFVATALSMGRQFPSGASCP